MEGDEVSANSELKARPYQAQLEEIAMNSNTIIYLPTGSGKTFIAICLIKRFKDVLEKPWGEGGKRTFFLVNNIPLVNQQKKVIEALCSVSGVGGYSSEDCVDYWDKAKWNQELKKNQVVVMTSQILSDMLTHQYIKIEDINLLIFDECHHAVEDHPMRIIMKHFEDCPPAKQPRVLGLTATLLNANVKLGRVDETLHELEITFHATIATVDELGKVLKYSTNPNEMVKLYKPATLTPESQIVIDKLTTLQDLVMKVSLPTNEKKYSVKLKHGQHDISSDPKKLIKSVKNMIGSMIVFLKELGMYGGALGILAYIILFERLKRRATSKAEDNLFKVVISHSVNARQILLTAMKNETGYEKIVKNSSAQVLLLLNTLKEYSPKVMNTPGVLLNVNKNRQELSAIIFTKQRFTAKILFNLLKDVKNTNPDEFGFLQHDFVVGFNVNPTNNTREEYYVKKYSQQALLKFKNSDLNCLISTSVIEEGIDIPQCLLVLRYDPPLEYRSYIQSKGRARSSKSNYVIFVKENEEQRFMKNYREFQATEKLIQKLLIGNDDRDEPADEELQAQLYAEGVVPPYIAPSGARLTCVSAISLLNRYCSTLPTDQFTVITPMWIHEKVTDGHCDYDQVTILLPITSPVKEEIKGMCLNNLKAAKRSAALNACIKLHEAGELDSGLLPVRYTSVDFDQDNVKKIFINWREEDMVNGDGDSSATDDSLTEPKKPGSKNRIRKHDIQFPTCLDSVPDEDMYYLHIIKTTANFEEPKESRLRALYNFLGRKQGYGFLTQKELPNLCKFPIFMNVGEVETSIEVNYAVIKLDTKLFDVVKQFHFFLFDQVLNVAKKFVVFEGKVNCMYVVPVLHNGFGYNIDWDTMTKHHTIEPLQPPSDEERLALNVTEESYKNFVVSPWYRGTSDRYIVSKVLEHMTPDSSFEQDTYLTFRHYYSDKYKIETICPRDQPLLEVQNISSRMNCLLPRAATIRTFTDKQRKLISASQGDDKNRGFTEIFVPEFCIKYDYPGVLWYKAMMLPSICHRVFMLLTAHELLTEISRDTKYGSPHRSTSDQWAPLEPNMQIAINSLLSQVEEPTQINSVDRINNPLDEEKRRPNILSMKESLYQLQQKKLNKEYPWDIKMEPIDIERNLSSVTVMDVECYDEFVSAPITTIVGLQASTAVRSPPRVPSVAISAPPAKYNDKIELLDRKPTNQGPELKDMLAALTTIKSHDTFDLERAETLGDAFLKFAATLFLFHKFPKKNEGQLTNIKSRLISNRNLYYAGERINLGGRMKVEQFSPRKDFLMPAFFAAIEVKEFMLEQKISPAFMISLQFPPSEALSGQLSRESLDAVRELYTKAGAAIEREGGALNALQCYVHQQAVADKTIADCVEAIIGTYLLSGGILGAIKVVEWMGILPSEDSFAELLYKKVSPLITDQKATERDIDYLLLNSRTNIETILNYKFKDPAFLLEALSHSSYIRNRLTRSYERLEFLGDAIIDFLITSHIFENSVDFKPGEMTDLRSALVNNVTFASYIVKLELHKFLCSELNPTLSKAIMNFVYHQIERDHEIVEDVLYLIDEEECHLAEYVEVPKVLSDMFEALVGAIYLDSGGDLKLVWSVMYRIMHKEINSFTHRIPQQPIKVLYEKIHACPIFGKAVIIDPDVPKIRVSVTITKNDRQHTVFGIGRNKKQAKRAAAKVALKVLSL